MIIPIHPELKEPRDKEEVRKSLLDLSRQLNRKHLDDEESLYAKTARFGSESDYSEFQDDGFMQTFGSAKQYKDLITSAANLRPGLTPPTYAPFKGGIYAPRFDAGVSNMVYGSFELQHDYEEGTDLYFHVHWSPTTTNTGNIVWGVEYTITSGFTAFPAAATVTGTPYAAPGIVDQHVIQNILVINGFGLKIGAMLAFRLFRQAGGTDTFTGNAFLHSVGVHYAADTLGSRNIFTKL